LKQRVILPMPRLGPVLSLIAAFFIVKPSYAIENGLSALPFGGIGPRSSETTSNTYTTKEGVVFIRAPTPKYPYGTYHLKGRAIVQLKLDRKTGQVLSVALLQSTGQPLLDRAALEALRKWRARPGVKLDHVEIPVVFAAHWRPFKN
jgi:TonB family protein